MTILLSLLGVLMVATSGRLLAHAIALPRLKLRQHLSDIRDYGFDSGVLGAEAPTRPRLKDAISALAARIGRFATAHLTFLPALRRGELAAAGFYDVSPETVHGYRALAAVL